MEKDLVLKEYFSKNERYADLINGYVFQGRQMVNNYNLNILEVRKLENTDCFHSDLKLIFDFIRFDKDKEKLYQLVKSNPAYQELEEDTYDVIAAFSKAEEFIGVKEKYTMGRKVDMCQALKELIEDGRQEGRMEGRQEEKQQLLSVVAAMILDGHAEDVIRMKEDNQYYQEMLDKYQDGKI